MNHLKVTAVSYLNTKPLLYGILRSPLARKINLSLDIPAVCAARLRSGEADLGLVPVGALPELPEWHLVSDYCIGAEGAVNTVALFSEVPLEEVEAIYLDHHSRTSAALTRLLLEQYWQYNPRLLEAHPGYIEKIKGRTAGLVIGDRTIGLHDRFPYVYDLGEAWTEHTGLPFVFAAWVSRRPLEESFVQEFNEALNKGIRHIPELKYLLPSPHPAFDLEHYFTHYISYHLDAPKRRAMDIFLRWLQEDGTVTGQSEAGRYTQPLHR